MSLLSSVGSTLRTVLITYRVAIFVQIDPFEHLFPTVVSSSLNWLVLWTVCVLSLLAELCIELNLNEGRVDFQISYSAAFHLCRQLGRPIHDKDPFLFYSILFIYFFRKNTYKIQLVQNYEIFHLVGDSEIRTIELTFVNQIVDV